MEELKVTVVEVPDMLHRTVTALNSARNAVGIPLGDLTKAALCWSILNPAGYYYERIKNIFITPKSRVNEAVAAAGIVGYPMQWEILDAIESAIALYESEIADGK